tara:strand:+ start:1225 stop:1437 length:213 start_codon:yes stop_codon:yes gene_type:complete
MSNLREIKAIQNGVYIVTYRGQSRLGSFQQMEGAFSSFKDAENLANMLRDEAIADGDFLAAVSVDFMPVY